MATFTGGGFLSLLVRDDAPGSRVTTDLELFTSPYDTLGWKKGTDHVIAGAVTTNRSPARGVVTVSRMFAAGAKPDGFELATSGRDRYEQIHVTLENAPFGRPNPRNLGSLLSTTPIQIEVWSAFRKVAKTLDAINITGPAGVTVTDPYGTPVIYPPLRSRFYTAFISISGGPNINNEIIFDFSGIEEPHAIFTGSRLVPFPFEPDWGEDLYESFEWKTAVLTADNGNEQRLGLRAYPRKFFGFTPKTFTVQEATYLESLCYGWLDQRYGVPAWHESMRLASTATVGSLAITVADITDRDLVPNQTVLLWNSPFLWEAREVASIVGTTINLKDALAAGWAANTTRVLPIWIGSLSDAVELDRPARDAGAFRAEFMLEPRTV